MRCLHLTPTVALILGSAPLCAQEPTAIAGNPERGQEVFRGRGRCVECHRFQGEGSFARGPSLDAHWAAGPALLERMALRPEPAEAYLLRSLLEPDAFLTPGFDAGMPAANGPLLRLSRQDVADLLVYLNEGSTEREVPELSKPGENPWSELPSGDAERGEDLYFRPDDAACSGCHIVRLPRLEHRFHEPFWRQGGLSGPELTRLVLVREPSEALAAIMRPGAARTGGYFDVMVETQGGRLLTGLLLADGIPGVLLMDANPSGPFFRWLDRDSVAEVTPVARSRMTHVFTELLNVQERLDILAFLRAAAAESVALGVDALAGGPWGARDPVANLYSGVWPEEAQPELLRRIPGVPVVE